MYVHIYFSHKYAQLLCQLQIKYFKSQTIKNVKSDQNGRYFIKNSEEVFEKEFNFFHH